MIPGIGMIAPILSTSIIATLSRTYSQAYTYYNHKFIITLSAPAPVDSYFPITVSTQYNTGNTTGTITIFAGLTTGFYQMSFYRLAYEWYPECTLNTPPAGYALGNPSYAYGFCPAF